MPTGMNNRQSRQIALRLPHDVATEAERLATLAGYSVSQAVIGTLREAWGLNEPVTSPQKRELIPPTDHKQVEALSLTDIIEREVTPRFKQAHKAAAKVLSTD